MGEWGWRGGRGVKINNKREAEEENEGKIKYSKLRKNEAAKNQRRNNKRGTHPLLIGLHLFLLSLPLI